MANDSILIQVQLGSPTKANINAVTKQIQSALSNVSANVQIQNGRQAVQTLQNLKRGADNASRSMNSFGEAIGLSGRRFLAFTSAVAVVGRLTSALSQATREAIKFEREFVKLAQVFDTDVKSLGRLQNSMSDLAQEFGLSATVIARTSVVLAQSGLTARQTEQAMAALAKTTLASTFDNIASTTEGAVAIMAQFGTQASQLESQLGAINAVSKKFAVESGDIIEAVRRAGGAFRAAGGNFEDFISLFTAVRSTTRESAETIATGFRTIFARIQRPRTIEFFRELNIELTDGKGNFIGAFEAVRRLSQGLQRAGIEAGSLKFASVVEQLGGIRQVSRVIPLLGEFTKAEKARQVAQRGAASLDADVAKAQETLAQSFARTTENFRALIREISQTASFQAIVRIALDLANAFIEVARSLKPLIPLIATFAGFKLSGLIGGALRKGFGGAGGTGGLGQGFNRGGFVPGTGNSDTVPAMLTPGEFVIRKSAVQAFGAENLAGINKYGNGGKTGKQRTRRKRRTKPTDLGSVGMIVPRLGKDGRDATETITFNNKKFVADVKVSSVTKNSRKFTSEEQKLENALSDSVDSFGLDEGAKRSVIGKSKAALGQLFEEIVVQTAGLNKPGSNLLDIPRVARSGINKIIRDPLSNVTSADIKRANNQKNRKDVVRKIAQARSPKKKAAGGSISGTDTVPALLTPGEFVVNKQSAKSFGYGNLRKINKYNKGGVVQKFQNGGTVAEGDGGFFQFPKVDDKPFKVVGKTMQQQNEELKKNIKTQKAQTQTIENKTKKQKQSSKEIGDSSGKLIALSLGIETLSTAFADQESATGRIISTLSTMVSTLIAVEAALGVFGLSLKTQAVSNFIGSIPGAGVFKSLGKNLKGFGATLKSGLSRGFKFGGKGFIAEGAKQATVKAGGRLGGAAFRVGAIGKQLAPFAKGLAVATLVTKAFTSVVDAGRGIEKNKQDAIKAGNVEQAKAAATTSEAARGANNLAVAAVSIGSVLGGPFGAALGGVVGGLGKVAETFGLVDESFFIDVQNGLSTLSLGLIGSADEAIEQARVAAQANKALAGLAEVSTTTQNALEDYEAGLIGSNQVLAQGQGLQIGKAAKALEDAGKELEPSKVRTFFASFGLADTSAGTVGSKENIEKLTQGLEESMASLRPAFDIIQKEVIESGGSFGDFQDAVKKQFIEGAIAKGGKERDGIKSFNEFMKTETRERSQSFKRAQEIARTELAAKKKAFLLVEKENQEKRRQIAIFAKQNALLNSLNATVNSLTLSAQKSADALANVKAAADLTATSTFGASGAEQLGDITNIVDPQKFSQALGKAVSLGFDPSSARQVAAGARASEAIKRPGGIAFQSRRNIQGFVQRTTQDPAIQASINEQLDKLQKDVDERNKQAREAGLAETAVVDPRDVQKILEDNLVKPSQEAANKMAEGLKANAERLNNFAASLDVYADSINKVRASQREQLESQIDFARRLKEATGGKRSKSDLVREARARQTQTLGGQTTFQGQSLINNPKLVGQAIRKLQKEINERGKAIRAGVGDEQLATLQKSQQERLKDLNKALDEQVDALKDFKDVLLEDVKLAKQKQDQAKEELKNLLQKNVAQRKEGVNVEVATTGFLKGVFDKRLLTTGGLAGAAQARGLSGEQAETLEKQRQLVVANLEKLAAADDKRAQALLKGLKSEELFQDIRAKLIGEELLQAKDKRLTVAKLKEIDKDARKQAKEQLDIAQGKGVQKAADRAKVGQEFLGQAQGVKTDTKRGQSDIVLRETQTRDVQQKQARTAEEAAKAGKANAATMKRTEKTNRRGFSNSVKTTERANREASQRVAGGVFTVGARQVEGDDRREDLLEDISAKDLLTDIRDRAIEIRDNVQIGFVTLAQLFQTDGKMLVTDKGTHVLITALGRAQGNNPAQFQNLQNAIRSLQQAGPGAAGIQQGLLTYNRGGVVYANEGTLVNYQPKGTDTVPAMLTPGEFVIRKSSVDKYGTGMMKAINSGSFANGGKVNYLQGGGNALFRPGLVTATTQLLSESVRNFGSFLSGGSLDNFASSVNTLVSSEGFGAFSQAVNKFEEIPKDFTMTVAPTQVTVSINGAEILAQIMPEIQSEILSQTSFKIEEFRQQLKSGDV